MKKFSAFIKAKKDRIDHFTWGDNDTVTDESLDEWSHENPVQRQHHYEDQNPKKGDPTHTSFMKHHNTLDNKHKDHRDTYKGSSASFNHYLRHQKHPRHELHMGSKYLNRKAKSYHDHAEHMDRITSHKIEHHHTVFRGGIPHDEKRFPVGHKFTDHGYTGTSFHHSTATSFDDYGGRSKHQKPIVHVVHVPPGTKGHYLDVHGDTPLSGEHELLLHRGTKFKVTHHSHDENYHYIHSRVIGQHARKLPKIEHEDHGITMTKHEDEKPHIKIKLSAAQKQGLEHLKKQKHLSSGGKHLSEPNPEDT